MRGISGCLAVVLLIAGCASQVPAYVVSPAKGQTSQQLDNDKFDCNLQAQKQTDYNPDKSLTDGALVGLLVGGALELVSALPRARPAASSARAHRWAPSRAAEPAPCSAARTSTTRT